MAIASRLGHLTRMGASARRGGATATPAWPLHRSALRGASLQRPAASTRSVQLRCAATARPSPSSNNAATRRATTAAAAASATPTTTTPLPLSASTGGGAAGGYKLPPPEILSIVDAPPQPALSFSPDRKRILQLTRPPPLPPLHEVARPELKLAGLRLDAEQFSRSRMSHYEALALVDADALVPAPRESTTPVTGYPEGAWINYVSWSPDGRHVAFTVRSPGARGDPPRGPLQLWIADAATGKARHLLGGGDAAGAGANAATSAWRGLNTVFDSYSFIDADTIIATVVPAGLGAPPTPPPLAAGPKVQSNASGRRAQSRTWTDLLKDPHDEDMLTYLGQSELVSIDVASGAATRIAPPRLYTEVDASPDGRHLLVSYLERPFSFNVPAGRFPAVVQLWRRDGSLAADVAALPLAEDIPIAFNAVRAGRRAISWRDDKPAELAWIEAQDGGDPDASASPRDIVYTLDADAAAAAAASAAGGGASPPAGVELARTDLRCGGVSWCDGDLALVYESWWKTRRSVVWTVSPDRRDEAAKVLWDRNYEDVYGDPGSPLSRRTRRGTYVLAKLDGERKLLLSGSGAGPEGNRPFLDVLDLDSKETRRLWQSTPPFLESVGSIMNDAVALDGADVDDNDNDAPISLDGLSLLLSREAARDPPQTHVITFGADGAPRGEPRRVTDYPHPYPQLRDIQKEVLRYTRQPDGVDLTATLYTPPGYDAPTHGPLPTLLWAYPREFKSKEAAGQMRRSPHQFSGIGSTSPMLWCARGYAVLDGPTLPIVAEGEDEPNDTYVEQLVAGARAAVDELVRRGVADPARVSCGGHSYGAFMAANLLAHAPDLFAAAVARSGAYNRTLTPFGFQSEERTLWQAPETYAKMSPFMNADKIKKPLLLVHGEDDNNTGTFPLQSERFYAALKGHGAPARLVLLPHEGHGYRARESVLHALYEQDAWLEAHAGYGRVDADYSAGGSSGSEAESTAGSASE